MSVKDDVLEYENIAKEPNCGYFVSLFQKLYYCFVMTAHRHGYIRIIAAFACLVASIGTTGIHLHIRVDHRHAELHEHHHDVLVHAHVWQLLIQTASVARDDRHYHLDPVLDLVGLQVLQKQSVGGIPLPMQPSDLPSLSIPSNAANRQSFLPHENSPPSSLLLTQHISDRSPPLS